MHQTPNILLILTDEQRFDTLGVTGCAATRTPHLDALAADGILLERHSCSSAICTPSRASIITGQYPRSHRAWHVGYTLDPELPNLPGVLSQGGYRCGFFGKSHLEPELTGTVEHLSPDQPYYGHECHGLTEDNPAGAYVEWLKTHHPDQLETMWAYTHEELRVPPISTGLQGFREAIAPSPLPTELQQTPWIADQTLAFIHEDDPRPWFATCSFVDPHHPWSAPQEMLDRIPLEEINLPENWQEQGEELFKNGYTYVEGVTKDDFRHMIRSYYALVAMIDDAVGRLVEDLKQNGTYENTLILFSSDHGDYNGDWGMVRKSATLLDSLMRVPTLMKLPAQTSAGTRFTSTTQHEDLMPTLLDLVGLDSPETVQGISFADSLQDSTTPPSRRYAFFEQMHTPDAGRMSTGVQDQEDWKYTCLWDGTERLVHLPEDPLEQQNLIKRYPEKRAELRDVLLSWMLETHTGYPPKSHKW